MPSFVTPNEGSLREFNPNHDEKGRFAHAHQNAFHAKVEQVVSNPPGAGSHAANKIMDVATVKPTPSGLRYKTVDPHAAYAIGMRADRVGHPNTQRYDNQTGHYIVHVNTSKVKPTRWK